MSIALEKSVIRILFPDGRTAGAGFLVAPDLAATCAHVVNAAGSGPGQTLTLANTADKLRFPAIVLEQGWSPADLDDLAFLRLEKPIENISPVNLTAPKDCGAHPYLLLGFPTDLTYAEKWSDGIIHGLVDSQVDGRQPILEMSGDGVLPGMSGAPIFDAHTQRVVGMLAEYQDRASYRRAYAVTADTIAAASPQPLELLPVLGTDEILAQILALLGKPATGINVNGDAHSSIIVQGEDNSIVVNLHDAALVPALERKITSHRDLKSYLFWFTVRPDFLKSDRLFVPL